MREYDGTTSSDIQPWNNGIIGQQWKKVDHFRFDDANNMGFRYIFSFTSSSIFQSHFCNIVIRFNRFVKQKHKAICRGNMRHSVYVNIKIVKYVMYCRCTISDFAFDVIKLYMRTLPLAPYAEHGVSPITPTNSPPSGPGEAGGVWVSTRTSHGELIGTIYLLFMPGILSSGGSYQAIVLASLWWRLWSPAAN